MFYITAFVYLIGAIGYLVLGSAEIQPWAITKPSTRLAQEDDDEKLALEENKV